MAEVRWSLTASRDLQDLEEFIARDSVLHAINFIDWIVKSAEPLGDTPQRGRVVPEFGLAHGRELTWMATRGERIMPFHPLLRPIAAAEQWAPRATGTRQFALRQPPAVC